MPEAVCYICQEEKRARFLHKKLFISRMLPFFRRHCIRKRNTEKVMCSTLNISGRVMKFEIDVATERQFSAMLYLLLLTCLIQNILISYIHLAVELTHFLFTTQSLASCLSRSLPSLFCMMKLA